MQAINKLLVASVLMSALFLSIVSCSNEDTISVAELEQADAQKRFQVLTHNYNEYINSTSESQQQQDIRLIQEQESNDTGLRFGEGDVLCSYDRTGGSAGSYVESIVETGGCYRLQVTFNISGNVYTSDECYIGWLSCFSLWLE